MSSPDTSPNRKRIQAHDQSPRKRSRISLSQNRTSPAEGRATAQQLLAQQGFSPQPAEGYPYPPTPFPPASSSSPDATSFPSRQQLLPLSPVPANSRPRRGAAQLATYEEAEDEDDDDIPLQEKPRAVFSFYARRCFLYFYSFIVRFFYCYSCHAE